MQPNRHLPAQDAAFRAGERCARRIALSGDDQNKPASAVMSVVDEPDQRWVGLGQCHAVQVDAGLRRLTAFAQATLRVAIDTGRLHAEVLGRRRGEIVVRARRPSRLSDPERPLRRRFRRGLGWALGFRPRRHGHRI
jgi:hypothetical protein